MQSDKRGIVHVPVLLEEVTELLGTGLEGPDGPRMLLVDCTLGEGGHTERFLQTFPRVDVIGLDRDPAIQAKARKRLAGFGDRAQFRLGWFDDILDSWNTESGRPDRVLFDLGISIFHYEQSGRGFSFRAEEPLDMRLDPAGSDVQTPSAADLVNGLGEGELADLIFQFGEERYSRRIARAIAAARGSRRIETSSDLEKVVWQAVPQDYRRGRIHPATRTFQALRIAVNGELDRAVRGIRAAFRVLKPGGILGVISFHSLEDRVVKNLFREFAASCICPDDALRCECGGKPLARLVTRKPVEATEAEARDNPPSRSAKLRVVEKIRDSRRGE